MKTNRIVLACGCFDILHSGHIDLLQKAKKLGKTLIVGINSDKSIRKLKGPDRPYFNQAFRKQQLLALKCVDKVIIFNESNPARLIERIKPNIFVKGNDYKLDNLAELSSLQKVKCKVKFIKKIGNISTTNLLCTKTRIQKKEK